MFASVTAEHFEGTLEYGGCRIHGDECYGCVWAAPDIEIPYQQHNEPNPILSAFRKDAKVTHNWPRSIFLQDWIDVLDGYSNSWDSCAVDIDAMLDKATPEHIHHARAVLTRLANITKEQA